MDLVQKYNVTLHIMVTNITKYNESIKCCHMRYHTYHNYIIIVKVQDTRL